jgi:hypothetical protein
VAVPVFPPSKQHAAMLPADLALALLINRTAAYYQANAPAYMTYVEQTHVSAPSLGRSQDINRSVAVRVADDFAVMQDLPTGARRTGQAFPIIAYFDPFSQFSFSWFANLKRVDITLDRGLPFSIATPPPDPSVDAVIPYFIAWDVRYAPDSKPGALHLLIAPTPRELQGCGSAGCIYPSEVVEDPQTRLPSRIVLATTNSDETIRLDYQVLDGHWIITHGTWGGTEHALIFTAKVIADVTFSDIAFPNQPPDPQLAGTPVPTLLPSATPAPPARSLSARLPAAEPAPEPRARAQRRCP